MSKSKQTAGRKPSEQEAKLRVGQWLQTLGCRIYDEEGSKLKPGWGQFSLKGVQEGKSPDLLAKGILYSKSTLVGPAYIAIEIKVGWGHQEIVHGFGQVLSYFMDYCWGAEYYVGNKAVEISAIVLATYYSPEGYIYRFEKGLSNNFIPNWPASPLVATLSRVMWAMRDQIERTFQQLVSLPKTERLISRTVPFRERPLVGILAKNVRKPNRLPYEAELLLSKQNWSWGIVEIEE